MIPTKVFSLPQRWTLPRGNSNANCPRVFWSPSQQLLPIKHMYRQESVTKISSSR